MKLQYGSPAMKRFLTAAMALCLLLSCLVPACAQGNDYTVWPNTGNCGPDATYALMNGVLTISGTGEVTKRHDEWPKGVTSVVIEEGITSLFSSTFWNMDITQVDIPSSMTHIGSGVFEGTPWLENNLEEFLIVGDRILLSYNGASSEVTIPDTVRSIAGSAFMESDITAVTVGSSVEHIGASAFLNCPKLERVSIADTIFDIEQGILDGTPWMRSQTEDFVIVGDGVLIGYKGPGGVVEIPDTVRAITSYSCMYDPDTSEEISITEVTVPDTVIKIDRSAFPAGSINDMTNKPPVIIHGARGSAAQKYVEDSIWVQLYRFVPFGQEDGSLFNFLQLHSIYDAGQFVDVKEDDWFRDDVRIVYSVELMNGKNKIGTPCPLFDPAGSIKLSEAITVAARVRDTYYYEQTDFTAAEGAMWYQPYIDYALASKIIAEVPKDLSRPATRAEFASMLAAALPEREMEALHEDIRFVDIDENYPAYHAVMTLVRAGVMQGKGEGRFDPDAQVKRCEAAAMLARCVRTEQRIQPDLT